MKVLVTGATGFVGSHLIDRLVTHGHQVTALVRNPAKATSLAAQGVRLVVGGFDDAAILDSAVGHQELIYHVAGAIAARNEAEFQSVNRDATAHLVAAAERAGPVRFVLVSSQAAGGPSAPGQAMRGDEPAHPVTQYGRSKLAGEAVVRASGLPWTILRPPAVYGPGDRELLRVFRAAALGLAPVFGRGLQQLSLVFGPDLADALVAASAPGGVGGTFYPAHPEVVTSRQLIETVGAAAGKAPRILPIPFSVGRVALGLAGAWARLTNRTSLLTADKANELFQPRWVCDPSPLTAATGWRATHDLASGARLTTEWYRRHRWL